MRPLVFVACLLLSLTAHAQGVFRAYLASYGSDTNPCTVVAPCRLLPAALNAVENTGEIWILDSANFNTSTVDISKSVSIMALPGQVASIVAANGAPALTVTSPNLQIALRNLVITDNATNQGTYGLIVTGASNVLIEDSVFSSLHQNAIYVHDTTATVDVKNTTFRFDGSSAISVVNGPTVSVARSHFSNSGGVVASSTLANQTTRLTLTDTTIDQAVGYAVAASSSLATDAAYVHVNRCTIQHSTFAIYVNASGGTSTAYVGSSMITDGDYGFWANGPGASVVSLGNNDLTGMQTAVTGPLTTAALR